MSLHLSLVTTFPDFFVTPLQTSILARAIQAGHLTLETVNPRDFTTDAHRTTDDAPYGGGPGMVMMVEPIDKAVTAIRTKQPTEGSHVVLLSARGHRFIQQDAIRYSKRSHLILICGHYGDVDQRVAEHIADEELSVGDFVLTGGEAAALVVLDATTRLLPGVLGNAASLEQESHQSMGYLSPPQYTRPASYKGWQVPSELLSGDPKQIEAWKHSQLVQGPQ